MWPKKNPKQDSPKPQSVEQNKMALEEKENIQTINNYIVCSKVWSPFPPAITSTGAIPKSFGVYSGISKDGVSKQNRTVLSIQGKNQAFERDNIDNVQKSIKLKQAHYFCNNKNYTFQALKEKQTQNKDNEIVVAGPSKPRHVRFENDLKHPRIAALQTQIYRENETPVDDNLQPPSLKKIKDLHKNCPKKEIYSTEMMPAELAYNIEYSDEYMDWQKIKDINTFLRFGSDKNCATDRQWIILVDYLVRLHAGREYPPYILYQNVKILHCYLQMKIINIEQLQTAALASMWLSLKIHNSDVPDLETMCSFDLNPDEMHKKSLLQSEQDILKTFKFEISFPDPFSIMAYFFINVHVANIHDMYYCSCYMIDLSLYDQTLCTCSSISLAMAAIESSYSIIMKDLDDCNAVRQSIIKCYSFIMNNSTMDSVVKLKKGLLSLTAMSVEKHNDYRRVYKKYNHTRYGGVSKLIKLNISLIRNKEN